jgi:UMF1 family MFS transporter
VNTSHPPVRRREIFGYCLYDFANSSYTTLITTVAYALYFKQVVVGDTGNGEFLWSVAKASAMAVLIFTSPILGALADHSGRKKAFLLATTVQTVLACAALWFVTPGAIGLGIVLFIIGTVGFEGGYVFYNALPPEITTRHNIGRISGLSWGTGFLGGLTALVVCAPFLARELRDPVTGTLAADGVDAWRASFVVVAGFFAVFSVPTFVFLRERAVRRSIRPWSRFAAQGFSRVRDTFHHVRRYRDAALFVTSAFFFYGAIQTVIAFSGIYARETLGMEMKELLLLMIVSNVVAVPGTLFAGHLADRIGMKRALIGTLLFWFALLVYGSVIRSTVLFWFMAGGVAIGMGSTQAIGRSYLARLSPPDKESEFFGFYILAGQAGAILSLLTFGAVASFFGGQRWAVLGTAPAFLVATVLAARIGPADRSDEPDPDADPGR